jgi:hypothetical protein
MFYATKHTLKGCSLSIVNIDGSDEHIAVYDVFQSGRNINRPRTAEIEIIIDLLDNEVNNYVCINHSLS